MRLTSIRLRRHTICAVAGLMLGSRPATAQQVTVQQPLVGVFQVNTTVSVPDRGSAFLGGVRSAASGRSAFGPLRSGSSLGLQRDASTATAHVYIHDLHAMDEALLASAEPSRSALIDPRVIERLELRGRPDRELPGPSGGDVDLALQAERLAEQAEARGKFAVAKLHWQRAARHGSQRAAAQLAERDSVTVKRR